MFDHHHNQESLLESPSRRASVGERCAVTHRARGSEPLSGELGNTCLVAERETATQRLGKRQTASDNRTPRMLNRLWGQSVQLAIDCFDTLSLSLSEEMGSAACVGGQALPAAVSGVNRRPSQRSAAAVLRPFGGKNAGANRRSTVRTADYPSCT